tara:strand:+ start:670 stop:1281 length:612 start_codon:yes stop_codon:yes gene_type:complete
MLKGTIMNSPAHYPENATSNENLPIVVSVNRLSPWGKLPQKLGATCLDWGYPYPIMVHQLPFDATGAEITACELGRIDVGFHMQETTVFLTWKFSSSRHSMVVETPLHIGLERDEDRGIPIVDGCITMAQVTQNSEGICLCMRLMNLDERMSRYIGEALEAQLADCRDPDFLTQHSGSVERWNERYATPALAHRNAIYRCRVA